MKEKPFITVSGADEKTDIGQLAKLDCEVGLLFSATPDGRRRYPRREWILQAAKALPDAALHICGSLARGELISGALDHIIAHVNRIQVNGKLQVELCESICKTFVTKEIITQHNESNLELLKVKAANHVILIDASGGRGIVPMAWRHPETKKQTGFAGGLGPTNLHHHLPKIKEVAGTPWWVDMEGNLRDEKDWFSLPLAEQAINIFTLSNMESQK